MKCQLTVITRSNAMTWDLEEWNVLVALTSLSAEPETLEQMAKAMRRYMPYHSLLEEGTSLMDEKPAPSDGPWCLIDMISRTVVSGNGFELPEPDGAYQADESVADESDAEESDAEESDADANDTCGAGHVKGFPIIWLDTPSNWRFLATDSDSDAGADADWRKVVRQRAEETAQETPIDARPILFGKPLLSFLADSVLAAAHDKVAPTTATTHEKGLDEELQLNRTRAIHAEWMMTPRGDLADRTPREILLSDRRRIDREIERRSQQWTRQGTAPPPLAKDTPAYRFGRFGIVQIALYFELIRSLLDRAWTLVRKDPRLSPGMLIESLAEHRGQWATSPQEGESCPLTPSEQIELESVRMPVTGELNPIDCDCPLCLEMASGQFGPSFLWCDGHRLEMENEFAFSLTDSREDWEREQADWRGLEEKWERENAEKQAIDSRNIENDENDAEADDDEADQSAWKSSYVDWEMLNDSDTPPGVAKMAIGFLLAELIDSLKEQAGHRKHVDALNQAYLAFRTGEDPIATRSAAEELRERLERAAEAYPDLVAQSADLQSRLDEVLRATAVVQP